jgi:cadmium resistance protein CadD (predicted permease)
MTLFMDLILLIVVAIGAFVSTNIDDFFILIIFFAQSKSPYRVVIGQYIGFIGILAVSLAGYYIASLVRSPLIGLLGIVPIILGVARILNYKKSLREKHVHALEILSVALVSIANGADNLGIYIPLFVNKSVIYVVLSMVIFLLMVAVWCYIPYNITRFKKLQQFLKKHGDTIMPIILILLGAYILIQNFLIK